MAGLVIPWMFTQDLSVTLSTTLAEALATFAASSHVDRRLKLKSCEEKMDGMKMESSCGCWMGWNRGDFDWKGAGGGRLMHPGAASQINFGRADQSQS